MQKLRGKDGSLFTNPLVNCIFITHRTWTYGSYQEAKDASEPILDPYLCKAYDKPPTDREWCLGKEVWMLKASSIYVEPWQ